MLKHLLQVTRMAKPQIPYNEFKKAKELINKHQYTSAEVKLITLLSNPDEELKSQTLVELYKLNLKFGRKTKALEYLSSLALIKKNEPSYLLDMYKLAQSLGSYNEAIIALKSYIELIPACSPNTIYNLAYYLKLENRLLESVTAYEKALHAGISNPEEIYTNIGVIYSELNQERKAEDNYKKALQENSNYAPALLNLAGLFEQQGRKKDAINAYSNILKTDCNSSLAASRLSYIYPAKNIEDPRISNIQRILKLNGLTHLDKEELNFALGKLFDDSGQYNEAFASYNKANSLGAKRVKPYSPAQQEELTRKLKEVFPKERHFPIENTSSDTFPVFICGMFRSGSTLLEQILCGHSSIHSGGEISFIPEQVKKMGSQYPSTLKSKKKGDFIDLSEGYMEELKKLSGNEGLITDKRPDNFLHIGLIKLVFPKARIIWTSRELLDNCLSIYFQQMGAELNYSVNLEHIAHYHSEHTQLMHHWREVFPNDIYEVSYENLVTDIELTTRSLLKFLELSWEPSCLDFPQRKNHVKTASIWQIRKPLYTTSLQRYKNYRKHLKALNKYLI